MAICSCKKLSLCCLKVFWQTVHWYGRASVCSSLWRRSGRSPVWILWCSIMCACCTKLFLQTGHWNGRSPDVNAILCNFLWYCLSLVLQQNVQSFSPVSECTTISASSSFPSASSLRLLSSSSGFWNTLLKLSRPP
uniref:Uncharacterized protein n=1 Tax=Acanthochromis polyacanthus TaxID=80966 RepID=A0A3Q1G350_9TELE